MIEGVRLHRAHDRELIRDLRGVRQEFADLGTTLTMLGELEFGPQELAVRIDEGRAIAFEKVCRRQFAVPLGEFGLVIEEFQVARRAAHEEVNDPLCLRLVVRLFRGQWTDRRRCGLAR